MVNAGKGLLGSKFLSVSTQRKKFSTVGRSILKTITDDLGERPIGRAAFSITFTRQYVGSGERLATEASSRTERVLPTPGSPWINRTCASPASGALPQGARLFHFTLTAYPVGADNAVELAGKEFRWPGHPAT